VVLGVVKFHDISRDKRLERVVLVWQLWKSGLGSSAENAQDSRSHHFFLKSMMKTESRIVRRGLITSGAPSQERLTVYPDY